jgi:hypothetical protein
MVHSMIRFIEEFMIGRANFKPVDKTCHCAPGKHTNVTEGLRCRRGWKELDKHVHQPRDISMATRKNYSNCRKQDTDKNFQGSSPYTTTMTRS